MLHLDIEGTLARSVTPAMGIPDGDIMGLRTVMRKHVDAVKAERKEGLHAWTEDPYNTRVKERCQEIAARVKKEKIQTVVWVGIGGSGLGPRVLQEVFEGPGTVEFLVVDTIDPASLSTYVEIIDWSSALVVVVSKSGNTLETMSAFFLFWEQLQKARKSRAAQRVIAITDAKKGPLRGFCVEQGIEMLPIPKDVGGRYCIFTPVGLLPLALLGADVEAFMKGGRDMDALTQPEQLEENPAALLAGVQYLLDAKRGYMQRVIMPYSQKLQSFGRWNQQLIAESLGKQEGANPFPVAAIGTQDQHSLLQQWMEGPRKSWHLFIREKDKSTLLVPKEIPSPFLYIAGKSFGRLLDACQEGTAAALMSVKRPTVTITLDRIDAYNLGLLFYCLLMETVLLGKLYRVDPYGQPGVELGKTITKQILESEPPEHPED